MSTCVVAFAAVFVHRLTALSLIDTQALHALAHSQTGSSSRKYIPFSAGMCRQWAVQRSFCSGVRSPLPPTPVPAVRPPLRIPSVQSNTSGLAAGSSRRCFLVALATTAVGAVGADGCRAALVFGQAEGTLGACDEPEAASCVSTFDDRPGRFAAPWEFPGAAGIAFHN